MTRILIAFLSLAFFSACVTHHCVSSFPKVVGHHNNDVIVFEFADKRVWGAQQLHDWSQEITREKLPSLKTKNYWDVVHELRKAGLYLPVRTDTLIHYDSIYKTTGIRYYLSWQVEGVQESRLGDAANLPRDNGAVISMVLFDFKYHKPVWWCATRTSIDPLTDQDNPATIFTGGSTTSAVRKAYEKSVRTLLKSLDHYWREEVPAQ